MALSPILAELGMDRYDRNARLRPALLALLPAMLPVAVWAPGLWTAAGAAGALVTTCGLLYLLSRYARVAGRRYEKRMLQRDGGWATTRRLRHADDAIDPVTKGRYHAALARHGHAIPTAEQEQADPKAADAHYGSAVNWLKEQTRGAEHKLLLDENVDYGFRRNLAGLKPLGVTVTLAALAADCALLLHGRAFQDARWATGVGVAGVLVIGLSAWLVLVTQAFVQDAADAYADRLLKQCERL